MFPDFIHNSLNFLAVLFIFCVGLAFLAIVIIFIIDISQTRDAIRRNFPVIGHFRYIFSSLGEFFRQYFFALDREELPFNRAERNWVYAASKNVDNTSAFGSTKLLTPEGTAIFVNCPFPTLEKDSADTARLEIGPHCKYPYTAASLINISGMSWGALSTPAVRALSRGAALAGCWMNTGEGALSPHHLEGNCDIVFQIGTANYGVRDEQGNLSDEKLQEVAGHDQVKMFEIKLSQGAKPGKGGILPGEKVTEEIARTRGIPKGKDSISPNRHPDIDSVDDLLDAIVHIRDLTGKPVGFKTVIGSYGWLEEMCQKIWERGIESAPDFITIDSGDGGTGAAPMPLIDNVGLTIRESLPLVSNILHRYGLRERIRTIASGKLILSSDVAWAVATGADFVNIGRGFMFSIGCIQAMRCNKDTCPTGVTTHNKRLQKALVPEDKAERAASYCRNLRKEVEIIAHSCGVSEPRGLKRYHIRIVQQNGQSVPLDKLYPIPQTLAPDEIRELARHAANTQIAPSGHKSENARFSKSSGARVPGQH